MTCLTRNDEGEGESVRIWPTSDGCRMVDLVTTVVIQIQIQIQGWLGADLVKGLSTGC